MITPIESLNCPLPIPGLLTEGCLGIPSLHQEEVVEASAVMRGIQIPVEVGDIAPAPGEGHHQDQQAKIVEMVPIKAGAQGAKKLIKGRGNAYEAKHEGNFPYLRMYKNSVDTTRYRAYPCANSPYGGCGGFPYWC